MQNYQHHSTNLPCHPNNGYEPNNLWQHSTDSVTNGYYNTSQNGEIFMQSCDFTPLSGDIFQPEEIFQLDQPLRPSDQAPSDSARSPTIILDLGNGSNPRDSVKTEHQSWMCQSQSSIGATDDSSSSCGRYPSCSPDINFPVYQQSPGCGQFNKIQDCQSNYNQGVLKSEANFEDKEASFLFSCDVENEKMKVNNQNILNAEIDPRYLCFSSEYSNMDQDCVSDIRYNLTEDIRHNGVNPKNYNPPVNINECKVNGKNFANEYGLFQEMIPNQVDDFVDCHQTLNKICGNLETNYGQKSIQDPLYFVDHNEVRITCDSDNINSYLQQSQLFNSNQSHFSHLSN